MAGQRAGMLILRPAYQFFPASQSLASWGFAALSSANPTLPFPVHARARPQGPFRSEACTT